VHAYLHAFIMWKIPDQYKLVQRLIGSYTQHVFAELCYGRPDVTINLNLEALAAGKDRVLARVIEIGGQRAADELAMFVPMYKELVALNFLENEINAAYFSMRFPKKCHSFRLKGAIRKAIRVSGRDSPRVRRLRNRLERVAGREALAAFDAESV
jgi:hypothetical protein